MTLAGQVLGGLASEDKLPEAYFSQRNRTQQTRGHNWELLRQRAETNGLYFDPLGLGESRTHALLWVAREDVQDTTREFDGKFLGIASPYNDNRVRNWKGVTVTRYFDATGREVSAGTPGAMPRELIPLAMYGFDYPKVPLLLIDFRNTYAPKRREMIARASTDAIMGIVGYSRWGNWPYMTGSYLYNFTRTRRGAATNAQERLKAYSEVRRWLALDTALTPELRADLQKRMEMLGVNPLEESVREQMEIARKQYAALQVYAEDPSGLHAHLEDDRQAELTAYLHGRGARVGLKLARVFTLGVYHHREREHEAELLDALNRHRHATRGTDVEPEPMSLIYAAGD